MRMKITIPILLLISIIFSFIQPRRYLVEVDDAMDYRRRKTGEMDGDIDIGN